MVTKSVQRQPKYEETPRSSYVITLASIADDITPWGQNPHYRDVQLRNFWHTEPYLASAIYDIIIRNASFNWVLDGPPRTVQTCQDMLHEADLGKGWLEFIIKFSTDFFTTDNGGFIEVIRDGESWNAPVVGIAHLDSGRCRRTGVPEWPVVYTDRNGAEHKMSPWQVISRSEFPSPIETMNGVGLCLHRDSAVLMADGSYRRIIDLVRAKSTEEVMTVGSDNKLTKRHINGWHTNKLSGRKLINIRGQKSRLTRGCQKRNSWVTEDHPILTPDGWKKAGELKTGDKIITSLPYPNEKQTQLLIGTLLADMSCTNPYFRSRLSLAHCEHQNEWFTTKINALKDFDWTPRRRNIRLNGKEFPMDYAQTKSWASLNEFREAFYPDGTKHPPLDLIRKYFSPRLLATWYMDNGNIENREPNERNRRPAAAITTCGFQVDEVEKLVLLLREKGFDVNSVSAGLNSKGELKKDLNFTVEGSKKLFDYIAPYIVPCMRYKLPYYYQEYNPALWDLGKADLFIDEIEVSEDTPPSAQTVYCIDVEETHNFITAGIVVHNCAVSRVLRVAQLMRDISIYKREKVSGRHAGQIHLISGVRSQEIDDAMSQHDEEQIAKGYIRYIKPLIFGTLDPNAKVAHETIDMASLPDGFDEEVTMKWYISLLAMGFGADYQDFAPLPGGGLGSSQQSQILHQKSRGKGPALFMKMLEHAFNFYGVLPRNVTFKYDEQDVAADMEQATLKESKARTRNMYIQNGTLTTEAVRQQMLDDKELTQEEFDKLNITPDVTPEVSATDEEPIEETHANENTKARKDFMDDERRKAESSMEKEVSKVLKEMYGEFKKRILSKGKALDDFLEKIPFADLIDDEELWQLFQLKVLQTVKPYYRKGALEAAAFNESLGLAVNMDLVNNAVLDFTRTYIPKWWNDVAQTTREGFRKAVLDWQSGNLGDQGLEDLVDALEPYFGEARARRIAVTETTKIFDEGNRLARESAGVKYEQWQTAKDDTVCYTSFVGAPSGCAGLDGQFFPLNSGPRPPLHVNCRCSRVAAAEQDVTQYKALKLPPGTKAVRKMIERDATGQITGLTEIHEGEKEESNLDKLQEAVNSLDVNKLLEEKKKEVTQLIKESKPQKQVIRKIIERDENGQITGLKEIIGGEHDS